MNRDIPDMCLCLSHHRRKWNLHATCTQSPIVFLAIAQRTLAVPPLATLFSSESPAIFPIVQNGLCPSRKQNNDCPRNFVLVVASKQYSHSPLFASIRSNVAMRYRCTTDDSRNPDVWRPHVCDVPDVEMVRLLYLCPIRRLSPSIGYREYHKCNEPWLAPLKD